MRSSVILSSVFSSSWSHPVIARQRVTTPPSCQELPLFVPPLAEPDGIQPQVVPLRERVAADAFEPQCVLAGRKLETADVKVLDRQLLRIEIEGLDRGTGRPALGRRHVLSVEGDPVHS